MVKEGLGSRKEEVGVRRVGGRAGFESNTLAVPLLSDLRQSNLPLKASVSSSVERRGYFKPHLLRKVTGRVKQEHVIRTNIS